MKPIIIIGTGLAGYGIAKELRKNGYGDAMVLVTRDDGRFYSKPMLSGALFKGKSADDLASASVEKMATDLNASIMPHCIVDSINPEEHILTINGESYPYSKLILAVGASPIKLPLKGDGASDVLMVNNLIDYTHFRKRLSKSKRVGIIGPGLIGSEFANDLLESGYHVELIGPDKWPISTLLPEKAGRAVQKSLSDAGAVWHLETFNGEIEKQESGYRTELENGKIVEVDLFLSAVGVRPEVGLARDSGLEVNRGIVTNDHLLTSSPDIYALGDCAEVAGRNLPYISPLMISARALGMTLTGTPTPVIYPHMPVTIKTTLHPIVTLPPAPGTTGEWQVEGDDSGIVGRFFNSENKLGGFCLTGNQISQKESIMKEMAPL
ncbi:MAG: FAD-dependent oxidoreductase [Magnetococcales bacterium]|nr:FAD-dependent oxidoreductase [Magnetococcales bacterium]